MIEAPCSYYFSTRPCVERVQVSIYLSVSAFHSVSYKVKMWDCCWNTTERLIGSRIGNHTYLLDRESPVGFPLIGHEVPFGHVGNPTGDSLRNAFLLFSLYCIPLGLIIQSKWGVAVGIQRRGGRLLP